MLVHWVAIAMFRMVAVDFTVCVFGTAFVRIALHGEVCLKKGTECWYPHCTVCV